MTRYIDADALHYTRIRIYHEAPDIPGGGFAGGYNAVVMSAEIHNAPTADVAPVRHGKWLRSPEDGCFRCSECGMPSINYQNYCCRCGARMVEDE